MAHPHKKRKMFCGNHQTVLTAWNQMRQPNRQYDVLLGVWKVLASDG